MHVLLKHVVKVTCDYVHHHDLGWKLCNLQLSIDTPNVVYVIHIQ